MGANIPSLLVTTVIDTVSTVRGRFGATTNRLQSALASAFNTRDQLAAAESRICDVDFAEEAAGLTRSSILPQAAASVLVQANLAPELALQLLG